MEGLRSAAATRPVIADDDDLVEARRTILTRLRVLEATARKPARSLRSLGLAALRVCARALVRAVLPAAVGLAAAHFSWTLVALVSLTRAVGHIWRCSFVERTACALLLACLMHVYVRRVHVDLGESQGAALLGAPALGTIRRIVRPNGATRNISQWQDANATADGGTHGEMTFSPLAALHPAVLVAARSLRAAGVEAEGSIRSLVGSHVGSHVVSRVTGDLVSVGTAASAWIRDVAGPAAAHVGRATMHAAAAVANAVDAAPLRSSLFLGCYVVMWVLHVFFGRLFVVYSVGFSVVFAYYALGKLSKALARRFTWYLRHEDAAWSALHGVIAPRVCATIVDLKSVFVKFGQYLGGRADIVPAQWVRLSGCCRTSCPRARRAIYGEPSGRSLARRGRALRRA